MGRRAVVWSVALLAGILAGGTLRRARGSAAPPAVEAEGPTADRVHAARARSEIRGLDRTLAALKEEAERLEREQARLSAATAPEAPPTPLERARQEMRRLLTSGEIRVGGEMARWLKEDPSHVGLLLRAAAEVAREKEWGPNARRDLGGALMFLTNGLLRDEARKPIAAWLADAQAAEADPLVRGWMLSLLDHWNEPLSPERAAALAAELDSMSDPALREGAFAALARTPKGHEDALRAALAAADPDERAAGILKAWQRKALPVRELRGMVVEMMRSEHPEPMIDSAEWWVPKYVNPFAPQETVALFRQTLDKPIAPLRKAVSMMVMGSLSTVFPTRPGRAELEAFARSATDDGLKAFATKIVEMVDQGKSYDDIRRLDPAAFGIR